MNGEEQASNLKVIQVHIQRQCHGERRTFKTCPSGAQSVLVFFML